jgi:hypothetical protein
VSGTLRTSYRCAFEPNQYQAVLEAAADSVDGSSFVTRELLRLALSMKNSIDSGWEWRMEDEA